MTRQTINHYSPDKSPFPPMPIPLGTLEEYEALSDDERSARYSMAIEHQLSKATYFSNKVKLPRSYLADQLLDFAGSSGSLFGGDSHETKQTELELARNLFRFEPLVSTAVKRLVSFTVTPGSFEGIGDETLEGLVYFWAENLGMLNALGGYVKQGKGLQLFEEKFIRRLLIDGDVVVSETWESVPVPIQGRTKGGKKSVKVKSFNLPTRLSIHNFSTLKVNEVSSLYNREVITMKAPDDLKQLLGKGQLTPEEKETLKQLPPHIIQQIKAGADNISLTDTRAGESFVSHVKLGSEDYTPYGVSFLNSCFEPCARKYRLRQLDESIITGLINRLTIIKAGLISVDTGKTTITPNRLQQLEQLLSQPKTNELILWPGDDISVEDVGSDGKVLEIESRYDHVNGDILAAIGVPRVLIDGNSEFTGERGIYASFLGLREFIDQDLRNRRLVPYISDLLHRIAEKNNFKGEYPKYQMGRVNLADPEVLLNQAKFSYDRGLNSERSAITDSGGNWDIEYERRSFESKNGIINSFGIPELAFNEPADRSNSGPKTDTQKVSKPDTPSDTGSNAARAYLKDYDYGSTLESLYKQHTDRVVEQLNDDKVSEREIKAALIVLFGLMKRESSTYIANLYEDLVDNDVFDVAVLSSATAWTAQQFDNWYDSLTSEIAKIFDTVEDRDLLIPLVAGVFARSISIRLNKYRMAIPSKVERAAQVSSSIAGGMAYATWVATIDEKTCEYCASLHGKSMEIAKVLELYPVHPECRCDYIEHTELPSDSDTDIPEKDPNNWSKVKTS